MSFDRFRNSAPNKIGFDFAYNSLSNLLNIFAEEERSNLISETNVLELMACLHDYFNGQRSLSEKNVKHISFETRKKIVKLIETDLHEIESLFRNSTRKEFNDWINSKFDN